MVGNRSLCISFGRGVAEFQRITSSFLSKPGVNGTGIMHSIAVAAGQRKMRKIMQRRSSALGKTTTTLGAYKTLALPAAPFLFPDLGR